MIGGKWASLCMRVRDFRMYVCQTAKKLLNTALIDSTHCKVSACWASKSSAVIREFFLSSRAILLDSSAFFQQGFRSFYSIDSFQLKARQALETLISVRYKIVIACYKSIWLIRLWIYGRCVNLFLSCEAITNLFELKSVRVGLISGLRNKCLTIQGRLISDEFSLRWQ